MGLRTKLSKMILPYAFKKVYGKTLKDFFDFVNHGMIYHPKKTKSIFYLPFAMTDEIQTSIYLHDQYYEIDNLEYVFRTFHDGEVSKKCQGKTILDIGANIGNHTCYFLNEIMHDDCGKCICFEVMPETFRILKRNIDLNHLAAKTELYSFGLGNKEMHASARHYKIENIGYNPIDEDREGNLEVRPLDSLNITDDIAFVKIDVEGMEAEVITGAVELLKRCHPYIMVESYPDEYPKMKKTLDELDYREEKLDSANYLFYK